MNIYRKLKVAPFILFLIFFAAFIQFCSAKEDIVVQSQDKLNIQVQNEPTLSGIFTVSPQGEINYPFLGPVYVEGLSLLDIKAFLTDSLGKDYLVDPKVDVIFFEAPHHESPKLPVFDNSPKSPAPPRFSLATNLTGPSEIEIIDAGDKLNIQVYKEQDLSGVFTVSSSGKINYPLLGEISVQGLSLDEFKDFLYQKLNENYVNNPQIEIAFSESPNKSVAVLGQVVKPGSYILTPKLTILKLMTQIGGFTPDAAPGTIRIVRSRQDGGKETIEVNMEKVTRGQGQDVALKAGDIIFVDARSKEEEQKKTTDSKVFITILGQVSKPGNYFYSPNLTLLRLVGQAGGFSPIAATGRIKIVRTSKDGKQESFIVDAGRIMGGGAKDVEVSEGDLIVVPESFF